MRKTDHFREIYGIYLKLIYKNQRMSACNLLDLQILGSQPIMPKNLPRHWTWGKLPINLEEIIEYASGWWRKSKRCQYVTGWTWKHWDLDQVFISLNHTRRKPCQFDIRPWHKKTFVLEFWAPHLSLSSMQYFLHVWELCHFIVMQKVREGVFYICLVL
jgi:hypothetical protein